MKCRNLEMIVEMVIGIWKIMELEIGFVEYVIGIYWSNG